MKIFLNIFFWSKTAIYLSLRLLKGAQVWDFDLLDSNDFYIMKSLKVGDFRRRGLQDMAKIQKDMF